MAWLARALGPLRRAWAAFAVSAMLSFAALAALYGAHQRAEAQAAVQTAAQKGGQRGGTPLETLKAKFARPSALPSPAANAPTAATVALGQRLFFDKEFSATGTIACASCHDPKLAFSDGEATGRGVSGRRLVRHTPTLWNLAWSRLLFWDGRAPSLEAQVRFPVEHPDEMGDSLENAVSGSRGTTATSAPLPQRFRAIRRSLPATCRWRWPPTSAPWSRHRRASMPGLPAIAPPCPRPKSGDFGFLPARVGAAIATPALPSPTTTSTISACRGRSGRGAVMAWRQPTTPSRHPPCASSLGLRPTCTTARWPRWKTSCATTRRAGWRAQRAAATCRRTSGSATASAPTSSLFSRPFQAMTPPQPSQEPGSAMCAPLPCRRPPIRARIFSGRQEVRPRARPLESRRDANRAQRRHAHAQCAHLRSEIRLQFRSPGATRSGEHWLSRRGYF